ncbi:hypothetical protein CONLIGDRAFT_615009 [Coniochaeta ligniaria NRRL 30616]|uniref:C2 NT-type domain-containing protein n=1 Tax=Coniochaeta ligniaria NRRL 30616 TaxID=1408157 RepID=A0A1J7JDF1_9PEZI|nr:hypothetical protein CONLIGDRAFT_615009 [Coniochaeta ligniaria NRRL 30616]
MASLINKARKPKFEVHLTIYDLNNVPLVTGVSFIKWHLPHSISSEHRGRTPKCPIADHRVEYSYGKVIPVRIGIDKNSNLAECPIEFEILQEFSSSGPLSAGGGGSGVAGVVGGGTEKINLGTVRINLSEYVEESEALLRSSRHVEEGVIRRYLLQDSKINSTLKVGILMIQIDGERNYVAPPLKTAPVFGGIAGLMASGDAAGSLEPPADMMAGPGGSGDGVPEPMAAKGRDLYEIQDMYRRSLAASWASTPGEMPADECIEDIFSGGDGFRDASKKKKKKHQPATTSSDEADTTTKSGNKTPKSGSGNSPRRTTGSGKSPASSGSGGDDELMGTLRPHHLARLRHHFHRSSGERTTAFPAFKDPGTGTGGGSNSAAVEAAAPSVHFQPRHRREESKEERPRSRSESLASLATTLGSERGRDGFKKPREVQEFDVREDMVAWTMGGVAT